MINKKFALISILLMIIAFSASIFLFIQNESIKDKILETSDLSNSIYEKKIYRLNLLPFEALGVGIIFLLISCVILFQEKLNNIQINPKKLKLLFLLVLLLISIFFIITNYYYLNHVRILGPDEGFHINNAKLVFEGKVPYIDFPYLKGFSFPYVHGLFLKIFGFDFFGSRLTALLFKIVLGISIFLLSDKLGGKIAGLIALLFYTMNLGFLAYFSGIFPKGPITAFLLILPFFILTTKTNEKIKVMLSMIFIILVVDFRLLALPLLFLFLLYFLIEKKHFITALITSAVTFLSIYALPLFLNPKKTYMGVIGFISSRSKFMPILTEQDVLGSDVTKLVGIFRDKIVNIIISIEYYNILLLLFIVLSIGYMIHFIKNVKNETVYHYVKNTYKSLKNEHKILLLMFFSIISISLFSLIPTPTSFSYLAFLVPLTAIFTSILIVNSLKNHKSKNIIFLIIILLIFITPLIQYPREQFVVRDGKIINSLKEIEDVGNYVASKTSENDYILTFETPIAVEANRKVLPGLERSIFLYIPALNNEDANQLGVINTEMLVDYINNKQAGAIVFSQLYSYGTFELIPEHYQLINKSLNRNYYKDKTFQNVLDWGKVDVFLPKNNLIK